MSGSNFRSPPHTLLTSNIVNFLEFYSQERKSTTKRRPAPSPATVSGLSAFIDSHFADATTANALNTCTVVLRKKKDNSLKNSPFDGVRLSNYRLRPSDVPREVFDWVSHFLWLKNCPLELATVIATRVASRMSTEMTSPSSELKPALVSSPESSGAAFSTFSADQDNIDNFSYEPRSSGLPSALCSVDVARQSRDMVDDMLEEMAADPAKTVDMVLDYDRSDGPTLGWGDEEGQSKTGDSPATVPASPKGFTSSLCAIKNGRKTMEDRHIIIHDLNKALGLKCAKQYSYYAIFDGHAGVDAATYSTAHLHHNLVGSAAFAEGRIEDAFQEAFEITDSLYVKRTKEDGVDQLKASGTTALCALIEDQKTVYLAWVGDSQAVLVRNGSHEEIMLPHKPEMDSERTRIQDLGGLVVFVDTWRVNGILSVTRAIGDPDHKPYINAEPSLAKFTIDSSLDFLVLGCDGLFDQLTGQDIASYVFEYLCKNEQKDPQEVISGVSTYLSQMAIREGSTDNITSIVLFFKPFEQLVATGYPIEGEVANVTVLETEKTPSESAAADLQSITVNSLPTATNGGHFPYTDFSELPVGTNFNLHSMPPAAAGEDDDDVKEDKEDATASVMKNPFEGYEDSGFDYNAGAATTAAAALDDYDATGASVLTTEQAANLDFETTDAMDDFTFTASATTETTATTVVPPAVESAFKEPEFHPFESDTVADTVPMSTTPMAFTPVESAPPLTDWPQMETFQQQQQQSVPVAEAEVRQSTSPFVFDDQKITEDYTLSAVPPMTAETADDWSQFEAPAVVDNTVQEPEHVQEDIFKAETAEVASVPAAVPVDDWSQFEATQSSVPAEQTAESAVHEDNLATFELKQSEEQEESAIAATLASEPSGLSHEVVEETKDTEKTSAPPIDSTFDMDTNEQLAEPTTVELVNTSSPFDTELLCSFDNLKIIENATVPVAPPMTDAATADWSQFEAPAVVDNTVQEPEYVQEDIFKVETAEVASVPAVSADDWSQFETTPSTVPAQQTAESAVHEDNLATFELKQSEEQESEPKEESVNLPEPIASVPVAVESLLTSLAESKTDIVSDPAPVDIEPKVDEPKVVDEPAISEPVAEPAPVPTKPKAPATAVGIKKPLASAGKASSLLSKAKPLTATSKVATKPTAAAKTATEVKPGAIKRNVSSTLTAARSTAPKPATSSTTTTRPGLAKASTTAPAAASRPTTRPSPSATAAVSKVGSTRVGVTAKTSAVPKSTTTGTTATARTTPAVPRAPISRLAPAKTTTQSSTAAKSTAEAKPGAIKRTVPSSTLTSARSTTAAASAAPKPATARVALTKTSPAPTVSRLALARPTPPPGTSRLGTTSRLTSAKPAPKATASTATSKLAATTKTAATNGTSNGIKAVPKKPATAVGAAKVGASSVPKPPSTVPAQANGSVKSYSAKRPMGVENSLKQELEDAVNGLNNGGAVLQQQQQQQQSPPPVANGEEVVNGMNGHNGL